MTLTDQAQHELHTRFVGDLSTSHNANGTPVTLAGGQLLLDHMKVAPQVLHVENSAQAIGVASTQTQCAWAELRIAADLFDRSQQERIATANIIRRPAEGGNIDPMFFQAHLERLEETEHQARLLLRRTYRRVVPAELRQWQKESKGVGEDLLARLLGHLGDPYVAIPHYWEGTGANRQLMVEPPRVRTISQLWQYAGHGDASRRKVRGMTAEEAFGLGSPRVKMILHLNAEACMKQSDGSHYRDVYTATRAKVADKVHTAECIRCGPSGKPAQPGTTWNPGHQHAHALRIVGKELLRDMWLVRHSVQ